MGLFNKLKEKAMESIKEVALGSLQDTAVGSVLDFVPDSVVDKVTDKAVDVVKDKAVNQAGKYVQQRFNQSYAQPEGNQGQMGQSQFAAVQPPAINQQPAMSQQQAMNPQPSSSIQSDPGAPIFGPELERLIDVALTDGVLTDKEKQVLFKRAEAMGIDHDEFEMYLDSKFYQFQKQAQQAAMSQIPASQPVSSQSAPKDNNKYGSIKKCPHCGAVLESMTARCPECGYEFRDIQAVSSASKLAQMLREVEVSMRDKEFTARTGFLGLLDDDSETQRKYAIEDEQVSIIKSFPIPNTKEDLFEFLVSMFNRAGLAKQLKTRHARKHGLLDLNLDGDGNFDELEAAYYKKLLECVDKVNIYFPDDPQFNKFLVEHELVNK